MSAVKLIVAYPHDTARPLKRSALPLQQRKSRRLVAKAEKQAVARQYEDGDLFGGDGQLGTGPGCLLQSCSADELYLLTGQVCAIPPLLLAAVRCLPTPLHARGCTEGIMSSRVVSREP